MRRTRQAARRCLPIVGIVIGAVAVVTSAAEMGDARETAWIANEGDGTVSIVRTPPGAVETLSLGVGQTPDAIAAGSDGRVYVANTDSNSISVINSNTRTVGATLLPPAGSRVGDLMVSPDGRLLYLPNAQPGGGIVVMDTANGAALAVVEIAGQVRDVAFAPDGGRAYAAVDAEPDYSVAVIDVARHSVTSSIPVADRPLSIAVMPDGAFAYVSLGNRVLAVIDTANNVVTKQIQQGLALGKLAAAPDGSVLYASQGAFLLAVDPATQAATHSIPIRGATSISFTPDSRFAYVSGNSFPVVEVVDVAARRVSVTIPIEYVANRSVVSADGGAAYVTRCGAGVCVIDTTANRITGTLPSVTAHDLAVAPDQHTVWVAGCGDGICVVAAGSHRLLDVIPVSAVSIAFTPNGARAYAADARHDSIVGIDTATHLVVGSVPADTPRPLRISPVGTRGYAASLLKPVVTAFDSAAISLTTPVGLSAAAGDIAVSVDGAELFAAIFATARVTVIDTSTALPVASISASFDEVSGLAVSPNGGRAYVVDGRGKQITVLDPMSGLAAAQIPVEQAVHGAAVAPDGATLFTLGDAGYDIGRVIAVDPVTNQVRGQRFIEGEVQAVAASPDGTFLVAHGAPFEQPPSHGGLSIFSAALDGLGDIRFGSEARDIAVTADGDFAYVVQSSGTILVVDLRRQMLTGRIESVGASAIAIAPHGTRAYAVGDGGLLVIDILSRAVITTLPLAGFGDIAVSPDGRTAYVTSCGSGTCIIDLDTLTVTGEIPEAVGAIVVSADGRLGYTQGCAGVCALDLAAGRVRATIPANTAPHRLGVSGDGKRLYVTRGNQGDTGAGDLVAIDTSDRVPAWRMVLGSEPAGIALSSNGALAYVANGGSDSVSIIDIDARQVVDTVPVGRQPGGIALVAEPESLPTATPGAVACPGDCDANGQVSVDEVIRCVGIALGGAELGSCQACDAQGDGEVIIDDLVRAVADVLAGCP